MPYDPTLPLENTEIDAAQMRSQLQGLFDLIQAIPAGPQGPPFAQAVVDAVNTLNPGEAATVQSSFDGTNVHLVFNIPRGADGNNGVDGTNGVNGADGAQGPPFTNFVVDGVNTLNPGENATVQANFDGSAVRLVFGVPRGVDGSNGSEGPQGPPFANAVVDSVTTLNPGDGATVNTLFDGSNVRFTFGIPRGADGSPGPPGEVSQAQLDAAMTNTSSNTNAVGTLDTSFTNDPPTAADLEILRGKINELILALRR